MKRYIPALAGPVMVALLVGPQRPLWAVHDGGHEPAPKRHYGKSARLGGGEVSTYVVLSEQKDPASGHKAPVEVGVEIPLAVMNSLPSETRILNLDFPIQARDTAVQFMMLGWTPHGHEPAGVYDRPHLDFHFYIQDQDEAMAIDPGPCRGVACDDYWRAVKPVPPAFLPEEYVDQRMVAPQMGNHLVDPGAPEFHGAPFTRTFIYGAYDGRITFFEPMITTASLMATPHECTPVKLPRSYDETAYHPTKYCTVLDNDNQSIRVFLGGFVYRQAPSGSH